MDPETKAEKMKKKTDDMRRMFNLPDTESVIQDYACVLRRSVLVPGRMFISQNYVCFYATLPETFESVPFRKITEIVKDHTALLFNNGINLITPSATYYYGSFVHRDETFNLLNHLWKHPPSYIDIEPDISLSTTGSNRPHSVSTMGGSGSGRNGKGNTETERAVSGNFGNSGYGNSSSGSTNPFDNESSPGTKSSNNFANAAKSQQQQQQQLGVKVDTDASRNALRIAMETRDIGAATMNELSYQAEVIDLIERDVENIHNNLDKANRLVRGIESVGGTIANAFSSEKKTGKDVHFVDRTLVSTRIEVPVDIQILLKLSNDDLVPAMLRFTGDKFAVVNGAGSGKAKGEKDFQSSYDAIESLWVRARPLHLDVRFKDKKIPRFRLMSSYVQSIVNEFCLRAKPKIGNVSVIFEPGTRKFAYDTPRIPLPSDNTSAGGERKAAFFRKDAAAPALPSVFKNASDDVKQGIMQQEQDLAQISELLGDMHGMATTMGTEIVRQTEQIDHVTDRVDLANDRIKATNQRIKTML